MRGGSGSGERLQRRNGTRALRIVAQQNEAVERVDHHRKPPQLTAKFVNAVFELIEVVVRVFDILEYPHQLAVDVLEVSTSRPSHEARVELRPKRGQVCAQGAAVDELGEDHPRAGVFL